MSQVSDLWDFSFILFSAKSAGTISIHLKKTVLVGRISVMECRPVISAIRIDIVLYIAGSSILPAIGAF